MDRGDGAVLDRLLIAGGLVAVLAGVGLLLIDDAAVDATVDTPAVAEASASATPVPTRDRPDRSPTPAAVASPSPTVQPETASEFFALWQQGMTSGETDPLLDRLHPVVLGAYGRSQCAAYLQDVADPDLVVSVIDETPLPEYRLTTDDLDLAVDEPTARITLDRTDGDGEPYEAAATLATLADGTRAWFTDCGDPL